MPFDPYTLGAGAALSLWSGRQQKNALADAQRRQEQAARDAMLAQQQQYDYTQRQMAPWVQAGRAALTEQQALMGLGGDTEGANRALMSTPDYIYGKQQSERSLAGSSAARGGMGSGKAMEAALQGGANYLTGQRQNRLANLAAISGQGYGAASNLGQLGAQQSGRAGENLMGMGNVGAAGSMGRSDINASTLSGLLNLGMQGYQNWNQPTSNSSLPAGGMTSTGSVPLNSWETGGSYWGPQP